MASRRRPQIRMRPLALIVATTPTLGIGHKGGLPWPALRGDLAHFARVTKARPRRAPLGTLNAVVMGRRTWESIPARLRPLRGRINVVVSPSLSGRAGVGTAEEGGAGTAVGGAGGGEAAPGVGVGAGAEELVFVVPSLQAAVDLLSPRPERGEAGAGAGARWAPVSVGHVFVIGGAQLYRSALEERLQGAVLRRIYQTRILREFWPEAGEPSERGSEPGEPGTSGGDGEAAPAYDTVFPLDLRSSSSSRGGGSGGGSGAGSAEGAEEWAETDLEWDLVGPLPPPGSAVGGGGAGRTALRGRQDDVACATSYEFALWVRRGGGAADADADEVVSWDEDFADVVFDMHRAGAGAGSGSGSGG